MNDTIITVLRNILAWLRARQTASTIQVEDHEIISFDPRPPEVQPVASSTPVALPVHDGDPQPPPKRQVLYRAAVASLGIDMAPTQDVVGCAEALSFVMMKAGVRGLPRGGILSTFELDKWLAANLTRVGSPLPGDVIMSPTGTGNGSMRGHTGIVGKHQVMSNNSLTFKWDTHWTLERWRAYYGSKGGLPIRFYRWA